jgi:hypothetical protein
MKQSGKGKEATKAGLRRDRRPRKARSCVILGRLERKIYGSHGSEDGEVGEQ